MTREEAIRILASSCIPGSKQTEALETLIPELAESEDERVRKEIIHYILYKANGVSEKQEHEWIAYLEKQKEPHYTKRNALFDECVAKCDPATMKEVSDNVDKILEQEWSEEDEAIRIEVIKLLSNPSLYEACEHLREESVDWLKTLHTKVNVNSEKVSANSEKVNVNWSEEDEKMLKCCLIAINHYEKTCNIGDHLPTKFNIEGYLTSVDKVKSWLKSLKPQSHWKPSEEQMGALLNAEGFLRAGLQHDSVKTIADLYEQLKKL